MFIFWSKICKLEENFLPVKMPPKYDIGLLANDFIWNAMKSWMTAPFTNCEKGSNTHLIIFVLL